MASKNIAAQSNNSKLMHIKVDGVGTANLKGPDKNLASITDNGTGDYTITFSPSLSSPPAVAPITLTDAVSVRLQAAPSASAVRLLCKSTSEVSASATFDARLKLHSQLEGADGNDITVQFADAVTAGSEAIASVSDAGAIVVNIEGGVSSAAQVHAAINADSILANECRNFISSEVIAAGAISTAAATALSGGIDAGAAIDAEFDILILGADLTS